MISGVLYAEDFDEPLPQQDMLRSVRPVPAVEPQFISPSFTLDELRAASEQAHEEGREAERHATTHAMAAQGNAALVTMAEQLSIAQHQARRIVEEALDAIARTTLSLLTVALPALCANHAEDELRALLRRLLPPTRQLQELHIRVHPALREAVESEANVVLEGSGTQVSWTESNKLAPGDVAITWKNGGALRDTAATCAQIHLAVLALFDNEHDSHEPETHHGQ